MVSTEMLAPVCLPQSSACCLKKGSAVGMKWFHCSIATVAPEMLAGACAAGGAAAALVGLAAGAAVGCAAGAEVGAGWLAACPHAAASSTTPPARARLM